MQIVITILKIEIFKQRLNQSNNLIYKIKSERNEVRYSLYASFVINFLTYKSDENKY